MSSSTYALALRIALLIEENSDRELQAATKLLRERGVKSGLLDFLEQRNRTSIEKPRDATFKSRNADDTTSLAVSQIRELDPEKYRLLSEFDRMIRHGQVLITHEALRRFGERISKEFQPRKSRKDTISPLMAVIAERPLEEIERLIEFAASFGISGDTDEYQRLAQFLIKGREKTPPPSE